jgi:ATP-GRASP peptide maturase of grasp-with-spasm system
MILILTEEADYSSCMVIEWLLFYNINFIRVNETDILTVDFILNDIKIKSKSNFLLLSNIKGIWYRRGFLNLKLKLTNDDDLDRFRMQEFKKIKEYLYYKLSLLPNINRYTNSDVNKLIVSDHARNLGLRTPEEFIISNIVYINNLNINTLATKSITGSTIFDYDNHFVIGYTELLKNIILPENDFFPTLIQNYIRKKYELRIFFLHGIFYSMAIFSQIDNSTKVDFRNYNRKNPNRNVPFALPCEVIEKLTSLMDKLKLNSGSIDMIVTPENDFVFLEVNPIGQYGMVSNPCNYNLNKKIADFYKNLNL